MPQKEMTFTEKLQQKLRGFKRGWRSFLAGGAQLTYERNGAILKGAAEDISKIRGLDLEIGALTRPFNGVSRVPDAVTAEIDKHVKDVSDAFARVAAVAVEVTDDFDDLVKGKLEKEVPLSSLEFINTYKSDAGNTIEQRLFKTWLR